MKVPKLGGAPTRPNSQLRDGTDDPAAAHRQHVPKFAAGGFLAVEPYIVMELIPGETLGAGAGGAAAR